MKFLSFPESPRRTVAQDATGTIRTLLLDDDVIDRRLFRRTAERSGIAIDLAEVASLDEFRTAVEFESYHVAFVDVNLGDGNGLEALDLLCDLEPPTLAIMISDQSDPHVAAEAFRRGCVDYVEKGDLSPRALKIVVSSALWGADAVGSGAAAGQA